MLYRMKNIICLLFSINIVVSFAQNDSIQVNDFSTKKLLVRMFTGTKSYHFVLKENFYGVGEQVEYKSIEKAFLGFAIHYNGLGGHVWIGLPLYLGNKIPYEENKAVDIQANFYKKRAVIDVNYQNFQGLYLINSGKYQLPVDKKGNLFRKDLSLRSLNANYIYEFNENFSLASGFTQSKRQTHSTGTFLFMTSFEWDNFQADSNLIPLNSTIQKIANHELTYGNFLVTVFGGGYGYNFVFKKRYFLSLLATAGPSLQWQKTNYQDGKLTINYHYNLRCGVGYNGNKWITGVTFVKDYQNYHLNNIHANLMKQHIKIFLGYRFGYTLDNRINRLFHL